MANVPPLSRTPASAYQSAGPSPAPPQQQPTGLNTPSSNSGLSGLVCNVHRTTGRHPKPLVGASTTILGDKLYVFGGRKISRTRPPLTADLYELDLIRRHWTKLEPKGDVPPPRYFHSMCALGDCKLVCYGGMSPSVLANGQPTIPNQPVNPADPQPEVVVMSDIHIFDVRTQSWMKVPTFDSPQGRYAHCAAILPSSSTFVSANAPLSAISHNPSSSQAPNSGSIGVQLDGSGGAEMVVVGGQDSANHYIEQISVFNLRSLRWTSTAALGRSCGAYRSVTAPLSAAAAAEIGLSARNGDGEENQPDNSSPVAPSDGSSALLIYSNYNFLDVKLELQIRFPDGRLVEKPMKGRTSPPGLRFPNGGVIANHFVVSGTFLTSSKQEYALWALDLRTLTWSRIDAGANTFSQGSWNRGVLWPRRNSFVILGNRARSLVEDYNHRRINFSNFCLVELEAFRMYDNPRKTAPMSGYISASAPGPSVNILPPDMHASGRRLTRAAEELGAAAMEIHEIADMDFMALTGERIPANSRLVARRWGAYFERLMLEGYASIMRRDSELEEADAATLRPGRKDMFSRHSSLTITPLGGGGVNGSPAGDPERLSAASTLLNNQAEGGSATARPQALPPLLNPSSRPRTLYLPHTPLTIRALLHYLYTSSLPRLSSPLCTPQILCSLLQIARPYRIDGLLEAVVERLHSVIDNRNTAAIFNAAAMAAGGGDGVVFFSQISGTGSVHSANHAKSESLTANGVGAHGTPSATPVASNGTPAMNSRANLPLQINTDINRQVPHEPRSAGGLSADGTDDDDASMSASMTLEPGAELDEENEARRRRRELALEQQEIWAGELSAVVGLQKLGLRGLMEGRKMRDTAHNGPGAGIGNGAPGDGGRVGLGIV
ncbi:hypothetical protein EJ06DRAFT_472239 [Trichodelitschia bisporula]|uniref:Galactose oxidase n=1 Tax=Trichodelitschia bisporula TaxID=703511 RepID=A0A6G1I403_9PEZI|nr:hypothetical protein EJ06DRAFT_472239 [Trichodelitschia bisporula]